MMKIQREVRKNLLPLLHKQTYRADTGKQFIQKELYIFRVKKDWFNSLILLKFLK